MSTTSTKLEYFGQSFPLGHVVRLSAIKEQMGWGWRQMKKLKKRGLGDIIVNMNSTEYVNTTELWEFLKANGN